MRWRTASGTFASLSWPRLKSSSALVSVLCSPSPRPLRRSWPTFLEPRARATTRASAPSASRWKHRPAVRKGAPGSADARHLARDGHPVVLLDARNSRRHSATSSRCDAMRSRSARGGIASEDFKRRTVCSPARASRAARSRPWQRRQRPAPATRWTPPARAGRAPGPATEESGDWYVGLLPDHEIRLDMDWDHRAGNRLSADSRHSVPSPVPTNLVPLFLPHHQRRHLHIHRRHQLVDRAFSATASSSSIWASVNSPCSVSLAVRR